MVVARGIEVVCRSLSLFTEIVSFLGRWYIPFVEMHPMFIARSLMRTQVTLKLP